MKDAIGGIFSIQAIMVFIVLAMGLLLFSVNYTKAFKMKNDVRRVIEEFEGLTESASEKINNIADRYTYTVNRPSDYVDICKDIGYKAYRSTTSKNNEVVFCVKCDLVNVEGTQEGKKKYKGAVYTVATFVNIDIPLIGNIFPSAAGFLRIKGDTALIYSSGTNTELCQYANAQ